MSNRINWGNYDLVVIDESHNFRNNDAFRDKERGALRQALTETRRSPTRQRPKERAAAIMAVRAEVSP
ncbi:hypothetical protein DXK93_23945 [Achromobacter sp. K91]|uniref:hypothetical protein n=1 Tax=Achromobacter sp. K91 TaxID=2292262 RepID=UPI000E66D39D|nr:hypothetical protein [Achromobacter sp. K91]RIJ00928.1 hypothetical protein DXK93_23945 [Achromobacter sp. K91]